MTFLWPVFLWALLLIPGLIALYLWSLRKRQREAVTFSTLSVVRQAVGKGPGFRRHIPAILMITALAVLVFSLSRPTAKIPVAVDGGLVVLVMDSSGSMRAQDVAPSRIEAAQEAARTFIKKQPNDAVMAIVAFAATAFVLQPATADKDELLAAVDKLTMQRGTAIGSGMVVAMNTILEYRGEKPIPLTTDAPTLPSDPGTPLDGSAIVLLTDGQNNVGPEPLSVVPLAIQRKLRIYTIGLGQTSGVVLEAEGRRARVVLDEPTLQAIADRTKADYFRAGTEKDLKSIYENLAGTLVFREEKTELTVFLAALAVLLMLTSAGLSLAWFRRLF